MGRKLEILAGRKLSEPKSAAPQQGDIAMPNTFLAVGIFAVMAAIVGGGLKGLGFELGPLRSIPRQIILAALGVVIILGSEWSDYIQPSLFPARVISQVFGPIDLPPGETHNFSLNLKRDGPVDVAIRRTVPTGNEHPVHTEPPELYVRLCSAENIGCEGRQFGIYGSIRRKLGAGPATISVFNFDSSPHATVELTSTYSE